MQTVCDPPISADGGRQFAVVVVDDDDRRVLHLSGELDLAGHDLLAEQLATHHRAIVVEMAQLSFMDCSGYGAIVAARVEANRHGGSLTLVGATGEPEYLLSLVGEPG